jgi:hypothetical protein
MPALNCTVLQVCDAAALRIEQSWNPSAPDEVSREYLIPVDVEKIEGRKVYVFPASYSSEPSNREDNQDDQRIAVLVIEKFRDEGRPPKDWLDERAVFVQEKVWNLLTDPHNDLLTTAANSKHWPQMAEVQAVYDIDMLDSKKVFWCEILVTFRDVTD